MSTDILAAAQAIAAAAPPLTDSQRATILRIFAPIHTPQNQPLPIPQRSRSSEEVAA